MYKISLQYSDEKEYPKDFFPAKIYPEYPFKEDFQTSEKNHIYEMIRNGLIDLKLDKTNIGSSNWNPLKEYVKPGDTVVIKPNLVLHKNYRKGHQTDTDCVYTHPSVVAAIIDFVVIALNKNGTIIVGDAPVQECDFNTLITESGYKKVIDFYKKKGINIQLKDFRGVVSVSDYGVLHQKENPNAKYQIVKLNQYSEFASTGNDSLKKIRITNYNPEELLKHHNEKTQEYCVADDILKADCIINVPKPKTHKKAGITACLKNLVGMNCRKEYLPHHTIGSVYEGGDEYLKKNALKKFRTKLHDCFCENVYKKKYFQARICQAIILSLNLIISISSSDDTSFGSWCGNNTISKTTIDLNKIAVYADKQGVIQQEPQRKMLNIADMLVSGQHNGPMAPEPLNTGIILISENSFATDLVIAKLMRAKINRIPTLNLHKNNSPLSLYNSNETIFVTSNDKRWNNCTIKDFTKNNTFEFKPPDNWEDCFGL